MELISECLKKAGLTEAFRVISEESLLQAIDQADLYDSLANQSFYLFLQSLFRPGILPATFQKLHDFGWPDEEVAKLFAGNVLTEAPTTLINAINLGALSVEEMNTYGNVPNQEIEIIFYSEAAGAFLSWLQQNMTVPKITQDAFVTI